MGLSTSWDNRKNHSLWEQRERVRSEDWQWKKKKRFGTNNFTVHVSFKKSRIILLTGIWLQKWPKRLKGDCHCVQLPCEWL